MTQPNTASAHPHHPHPAHPVRRRAKPSGRLRRLIVWEWALVLGLLAGLGVTLLVISRAPENPRRDADALVARMKAMADLTAPGEPVTMTRVSPKVCVLAAWDLYRLGTIAINGVVPQRVTAAKLVDLCNDGGEATIIWSPK
jgi:hypothetical protein